MASVPSGLAAALADRYRIERELGQGGMATVYLAYDLKNDRQVAIKVLRPDLVAIVGAERFLAEIRTTANLQHPHILSLFDSGAAGSFLFYVMPFIDGESLRDRLNREKQLPIADGVRIASEVASALDYAHRRGVIHRDIKPENILLDEGRVLVADFGIALAASKAGGSRMTETGLSLGTPQYMSPEQAMGQREITARSDVYALGCVTYEMLVGEPPFTGPTAQAIFAKVMTEKPAPLIRQRDTVPEPVEDAILTALAKLPADRFATAGEFAAALITSPGISRSRGRPAVAPAARWKTILAWSLACVVVAVAAAGLALRLQPEPSAPIIRQRLTFEASKAPVGGEGGLSLWLTPDGSRLVYVGPGSAGGQLWVQSSFDELQPPVPIAGTDGVGHYILALSPDGYAVAFWQQGKLRTVPLNGGPVSTVADSVSEQVSLAWLDDGTIIYKSKPFGDSTFRSVKADGGPSRAVPLRITPALTGFVAIVGALPDSRGVILVHCPTYFCAANGEVWILDLKSHEISRVLNANGAWYLASGLLVYVSPQGGVYAGQFDLRTLKVSGNPVPILDSVQMGVGGSWDLAVSSNGTLLYRAGGPTTTLRQELVWVNRNGKVSPIDSTWKFTSFDWALSPDGSQVALTIVSDTGSLGIWVKHLPRGAFSRMTFDTALSVRPRWTADGRSVTFYSDSGLHLRHADGTGTDSVLLRLKGGVWWGFQTAEWVVVGTKGPRGHLEIVGRRTGTDTAVVKLIGDSAFDVTAPMLSPDGRWLAYTSNETGRIEVYVRPFPNTESSKVQLSTGGGTSPLWAHSGRELFYLNLAGEMMMVPVTPGSPFRPEEPRMLFRLGKDLWRGEDIYTWYDVSPDDRGFLMTRRVDTGEPETTSLIVVHNWVNDIKAKMKAR